MEDLVVNLLPEEMNFFERNFWKGRGRPASRCFYSVMRLLEGMTGADRDALGTDHYMASWMDPFDALQQAVAGGYTKEFVDERDRVHWEKVEALHGVTPGKPKPKARLASATA